MSIEFAKESLKAKPSPTELLNAQFREVLQTVTGAEELKQEAITLGVQARSAKQRAAVKAYLFWRDAEKSPGYLVGLYAERGIKHNQLARNSVNFNPLVRLLYGHLSKETGWVVNMAKSLNAIDNEYCRDPAIYRADPTDRLSNWVGSNGGLSGIRSKIADLDTETEQDVLRPKATDRELGSKSKYRPPSTQIHRKILQKHTSQLISAAGAVLPINDVVVSNDNSAMTDLVVLLARRDANGAITHIGSTSERYLVEQAVTACVRFDHSNLPPILATLTECLLPHCVPRAVVMKGTRRKWFSLHRVLVDDGGATEKRSENVRLAITTDGAILVSKVHAQAGLTTFSKPKLVNLASDETLFLRGIDRYHLEHNLVLGGQISLCSSEPADSFGDVDAAVIAGFTHQPAKALTLKSDTIKNRTIYLHPYSQAATTQPTIKNPDQITYDWSLTASKTYCGRFWARTLWPWLMNVKNGLGASGNTAFNVVFSADDIEVRSKWLRDKKRWDRTAAVDPACSTPFDADAVIEFSNEDDACASVIVNPHDLIELISVLSTSALIGQVKIEGNAHLLHFVWETAVATHEAFVPSSNLQGHRNAAHFKGFETDA